MSKVFSAHAVSVDGYLVAEAVPYPGTDRDLGVVLEIFNGIPEDPE